MPIWSKNLINMFSLFSPHPRKYLWYNASHLKRGEIEAFEGLVIGQDYRAIHDQTSTETQNYAVSKMIYFLLNHEASLA